VQQNQRRAAVNLRRAQLTLDELQGLPEATPMFKTVGKA
jgi:chaperonin cofactor prefoldin